MGPTMDGTKEDCGLEPAPMDLVPGDDCGVCSKTVGGDIDGGLKVRKNYTQGWEWLNPFTVQHCPSR